MSRLTLQILILASLLHDIGKFAQRALRPKSKQLESTYCPSDPHSKAPTHVHVLYTDYFIEHDLPLPEELEGYRAKIARLASAHHLPDSSDLLETALCIGDRLSSGTDRMKDQHVDAGNYKQARLMTVFDYIDLSGSASDEYHYYPLSPLDSKDEKLFPTSLQEAQKTDYGKLFDDFLDDLNSLPLDMGIQHYIASLQSLLEKYTWCIPSSTYKTDPDISLFDHSVTTAAISQALALYHTDYGGVPGKDHIQDDKFILCGGDLSGIQDYIFGIEKSHGAGVAKILRARSFWLQAVTRSVVTSLLDQLGLCSQARIMDSGGQFILLLPATEKVLSKLPKFEKQVHKWFLETFQGQVTLTMSYEIKLKERDLDMAKFQNKFNEFHQSLQKRKLHRFESLTRSDSFPAVFPLDYSKFQSGTCQVCNINPASSEASQAFYRDYDREVSICSTCGDQIMILGKQLPRKKFVVFSRKRLKDSIETFDNIFLCLRSSIDDRSRDALEIINYRDFDSYTHQAVAGHLPVYSSQDISDLQYRQEIVHEADNIYKWGEEKIEEDSPKTLNMLASASRIFDQEDPTKSRGKSFLGAFKADVDNLGLIFGLGLKNKLSISRFSFLSRMINHFFSDYLIKSIQDNFPNIYVVFAGGDDLFFLGPWNEVVDISTFIANRFRDYVAHNQDITLSAGITVHKSGEPVQNIARMAENELEKSKKRKVNDNEIKNAASMLGVTVDWERFSSLIEKGKWIEDLLLQEKITKGLVGRLLWYSDQHKKLMDGNIEAGIYTSHMEYDFRRNIHDRLKDKMESDEIAANLKDLYTIENLRLPISLALYRLRSD